LSVSDGPVWSGAANEQDAFFAAGLVVALAIGYVLVDRRSAYGVYHGIGKLTGARLDIGPVNFAELARRNTPNDALACPRSRCPSAKPDWETRTYDMPPTALIKRLIAVASAEPNTSLLRRVVGDSRARFIRYSRVMHFPDTIDAGVLPVGDDQSTLAIYWRSLVGYGDFGVNRAQLKRSLPALEHYPDRSVSSCLARYRAVFRRVDRTTQVYVAPTCRYA